MISHIIQTQYLDITLNGTEADGLALQQNLATAYTQSLLPTIECVLNRLSPANMHWVIDYLELDLGLQQYESIETWAKTLERTLEQALLKQQPAKNRTTHFELKDQSTQYQTTHSSLQTAFFHFLQTGSFPWSFRLPSDQTLEQALLADWKKNNIFLRASEKQKLFSILSSEAVCQRLTWQFSTEFLWELILQLAPYYANKLKLILPRLNSAKVESTSLKTLNLALWQASFYQLADHQQSNQNSIMRTAFKSLSPAHQSELSQTLSMLWPDILQADIPKSTHPIPSPKRLAEPFNLGESSNLEAIYTPIAGLVLLHPFLPAFFQALGMAKDEELLQAERAPALLYFLATGQTFAPEHELALPKILCNLPLNQPVLADAELSEAEQAEAESLLKAVVRHWTALQDTSTDGLRHNFLMRLGKVFLNPDGEWRLQVEHQTYDLLLDQLPWGIGMFKLPWMQRLFWVEWY